MQKDNKKIQTALATTIILFGCLLTISSVNAQSGEMMQPPDFNGTAPPDWNGNMTMPSGGPSDFGSGNRLTSTGLCRCHPVIREK
ncbi:MAG: hypothetical protein M1540_06665 [Candidatus Bathyarchaeota archaeon]|nr:hypothetical protein [Candidatus Bathyarchaeota archaeon]